MGYLFGQKRRKVGRLQRRAARCFRTNTEADSVEIGTWCWGRAVLIENRPLTESERVSMNRAARSIGAPRGVTPILAKAAFSSGCCSTLPISPLSLASTAGGRPARALSDRGARNLEGDER